MPSPESATVSPAVQEARRLLEEKKPGEAEPVLLKAVRDAPRDAEAHYTLAGLYLNREDFDKAIQSAKKAVELEGSSPRNHLMLARASVFKATHSNPLTALGPARAAKREYEATIALDPKNVDARYELVQYLLGAPGVAGGDENAAVKQAEAIQVIDPLIGRYAWARIWEKRSQRDKVEAVLREAVALDTATTLQGTRALGMVLMTHGKYAEADSTWQSLLVRRPDDMAALYQVGKTLVLGRRDLPRAEDCFRRYMQAAPAGNSPSWAAAHWRLGMVYDLQGKREAALPELRKAVDLEPRNKEFRATLKEVERKK